MKNQQLFPFFLPSSVSDWKIFSAILGKEPANFSKKNVFDNNPYLMKLHGGYITNADFIKNLI